MTTQIPNTPPKNFVGHGAAHHIFWQMVNADFPNTKHRIPIINCSISNTKYQNAHYILWQMVDAEFSNNKHHIPNNKHRIPSINYRISRSKYKYKYKFQNAHHILLQMVDADFPVPRSCPHPTPSYWLLVHDELVGIDLQILHLKQPTHVKIYQYEWEWSSFAKI